MITTLIIDDEPNALNIIRGIVETLPREFTVVGEAGDVKSGIEQIRKHRPGLVLLDINMPDGNAFNLLDEIGK